MKKIFLIVIVVSMAAFIAGCSQNAKKDTSAAATAPATTTAQEPAAPAAVVADKASETVLPELTALYAGVTLKVTNLKDNSTEELVIPFGADTKLGKSPLTVKVVQFMPDFVINEGGYASKTLEPNNVGAKVIISGAEPAFNGWLFASYPDIHPYESAEFKVILINAVKK
ncbi:MAG: DUF2155 domain-containing protein [Deferribacteraceae bacterium]|jgi:ABC-type Fe3+-hydroxamate transport system substrate-binding protein|nr:DUF2155 domain-containing protein [Deferribacteraceae bacterium]